MIHVDDKCLRQAIPLGAASSSLRGFFGRPTDMPYARFIKRASFAYAPDHRGEQARRLARRARKNSSRLCPRLRFRRNGKTLREERAGRPCAERSETGGCGSAVAPRRPCEARSRHRGAEASHEHARKRTSGATTRRAVARPRPPRKGEARRDELDQSRQREVFRGRSGTNRFETRRVRQDSTPTAYLCTPSGSTDAEIARLGAGVPLPRKTSHVGKRQTRTLQRPATQMVICSASFHSLCTETLWMRPRPHITVRRNVRPDEMNGSGSPVMGTSPMDIAMLT